MLARIVNGVVAEYPYSAAQLRAAFPQTSFPADLCGCDLAAFGAAHVVAVPPPALQPGEAADEGTPTLVSGEWRQTWTVRAETPEELAAAQAAAIVAIDAEAEAARLRFVTPGAAQQLVYEGKRHEAVALAADVTPTAEEYPFLSAEVGITAATLADVGATVLAITAQWRAIAAAIEHLRLGAKAAVAAATTIAAVRAASAGIAWPQPE